jgi:hypothetical protein
MIEICSLGYLIESGAFLHLLFAGIYLSLQRHPLELSNVSAIFMASKRCCKTSLLVKSKFGPSKKLLRVKEIGSICPSRCGFTKTFFYSDHNVWILLHSDQWISARRAGVKTTILRDSDQFIVKKWPLS